MEERFESKDKFGIRDFLKKQLYVYNMKVNNPIITTEKVLKIIKNHNFNGTGNSKIWKDYMSYIRSIPVVKILPDWIETLPYPKLVEYYNELKNYYEHNPR